MSDKPKPSRFTKWGRFTCRKCGRVTQREETDTGSYGSIYLPSGWEMFREQHLCEKCADVLQAWVDAGMPDPAEAHPEAGR